MAKLKTVLIFQFSLFLLSSISILGCTNPLGSNPFAQNLFLSNGSSNGPTGIWSLKGNPTLSAGAANYISLAIDPSTNTPYVAFEDAANSNKVTVMKYSSGTWTVVGAAGFTGSTSTFTSLAIDSNGNLFVAYTDASQTNKLSVMTYSNSASCPGGVGAAACWNPVGGALGISAGRATQISMAIDPTTNNPFVAYRDWGNLNRMTVQKFSGGAWSVVGTVGFSAGIVAYTSLAIDSNGVPYVAYEDNGSSNNVTVMSYSSGA